PLSAKAFVEENRRTMIFLEPERFTDASEEVWNGYFFSEEPDGYFKGAHMDLSVIVPFSKLADNGEWRKSGLTKIKDYILKQLEEK
ncbi:MAG: CapA family protein, partial [Clostridia bacterium]|nr:CapA family protein [Clostridia bacterium]